MDTTAADAARAFEEVLASFVDTGPEPPPHSRAVLVLDAGCEALAGEPSELNFLLIAAQEPLDSSIRRKTIACHRIVVTRNTRTLIDAAPVDEFAIVGLDGLPASVTAARAAEIIARAFRTHELRWKRASWLLLVHPGERHAFRWLG